MGFMLKRRLLLQALVPISLSACDQAPDAQSDMRDQLVGTWLREFEQDGVKVRRVLVLEQSGMFRETARMWDGDGLEKHVMGEGDWLFDGRNFKRRYARVEGGRIQFATLEVSFPSHSEFVGVDNVHKRTVTYRRVYEGTQA
jgi:hypothetical protein